MPERSVREEILLKARLLTEGQRVLPARLLAEGFAFAHPRLPEALAALLA